jgi:branched-chain amino acid transport system permease protein
MLGGTNSPVGALIGTFLLVVLQEWLKPLRNYMMLLYGLGIIILMIFQPEGIVGGIKILYEKYKRSKAKAYT